MSHKENIQFSIFAYLLMQQGSYVDLLLEYLIKQVFFNHHVIL